MIYDIKRSVIEEATLYLLENLGEGKTICPSDIARYLAKDWRPLLPEIHDIVKEMVAWGSIQITQGGEVVDPRERKGAYRIKLQSPDQ